MLVNDWLNPGFVRKPGQTVLQTWPGTPYKRLSLDRPALIDRPPLEDRPGLDEIDYRQTLANETVAWQYVLAESDYMPARMRSAHDYPGETWILGYPRRRPGVGPAGFGRSHRPRVLARFDGYGARLSAQLGWVR